MSDYYIPIPKWVEEESGNLGFALSETENISSAMVELFYKTCFRSYNAITDTAETLNALWDFYLMEMLGNLQREYLAMTSIYNPLDNYSMTEIGTDTNTQTNDLTNTSNTSTNFGNHSITNTESNVPYDSTTEKEVGKNETVDSAHTDTGSGTSTSTGTVSYVNEHNFTRTGNIGTLTSADIIEKELNLRKHSIIRDFLIGFANRYFFLPIGEIDCGVCDIDRLVEEILRRLPKAESEVF